MFQLRPYQADAVASLFAYFNTHPEWGNPLAAMPTGTGKSSVIAEFIRQTLQSWPSERVMVLTHVKELIEQNEKTMQRVWPYAPTGIYSAGLKRRDTAAPIIYGGIQSVCKNVAAFGYRSLLLIDEAHLLSQEADSRYGETIEQLKVANPYIRVIGFTATPYRLGQGMLTNDGLFTDICYDITGPKDFLKLIDDGFLVPPIPKRTKTKINIDGVKLSKGDYNQTQLEASVDTEDLNYKICKEMVAEAGDRRTWLVFAAGIKHAEHIAQMLRGFGISAKTVHSKMEGSRDETIADLLHGRIRCVVNYGVLTTGFDCPAVDYIGMLRPTVSPGLWVQMLGRGTRPSPATGKINCLVSDFAGNTARLGPINDPLIPKKKGDNRAAGIPPIRICELCATYNHASAARCSNCLTEFPRSEAKLVPTADTAELLRTDVGQQVAPDLQWFDVLNTYHRKITPNGKPAMLKVSYFCSARQGSGTETFTEVVCFEHQNKAKGLAAKWWKERGGTRTPATVDEAIAWAPYLRVPERVQVHMNTGKFPKIVGHRGWKK